MNYRERKEFVNSLIRNVRRDLVEKLEHVPETWDGHELRKWIAERFQHADMSRLMTGKRLKDYRNEVLVRNL